MKETQIPSLGRKGPQEEKMATHSSLLAWRMPWTEEPGGLQSLGVTKSTEHTYTHAHTHIRNENIFTFLELFPRIFSTNIHPSK